MTTPEAQARARWPANRQTRARFDVREDDFAYVVERFEIPAPDERPLRYDGLTPAGAWLEAAGLVPRE